MNQSSYDMHIRKSKHCPQHHSFQKLRAQDSCEKSEFNARSLKRFFLQLDLGRAQQTWQGITLSKTCGWSWCSAARQPLLGPGRSWLCRRVSVSKFIQRQAMHCWIASKPPRNAGFVLWGHRPRGARRKESRSWSWKNHIWPKTSIKQHFDGTRSKERISVFEDMWCMGKASHGQIYGKAMGGSQVIN